MSSIKLKHSGGNSVIIAAPASNPASDRTLTLPSNADGTVLTTTNPKAGNIVQVKQTVKTDTFSATVSYGDLSAVVLSCSFTASSTSNKLLLKANLYCNSSHQPTNNGSVFTDDGSTISGAIGDASGTQGRVSGGWAQVVSNEYVYPTYVEYLHTPSNTSSHTYGIKLYQGSSGTGQTLAVNFGSTTDTTVRIRPISTLTIMEIAG